MSERNTTESVGHTKEVMMYKAAAYLEAGVATKTLTHGGFSSEPFINDDQLGKWLGIPRGS